MKNRTPALCTCLFVMMAATAWAQVPDPTVSGPVAAAGIPGSSAHNYTFFARTTSLPSGVISKKSSSSRPRQIGTRRPRKQRQPSPTAIIRTKRVLLSGGPPTPGDSMGQFLWSGTTSRMDSMRRTFGFLHGSICCEPVMPGSVFRLSKSG